MDEEIECRRRDCYHMTSFHNGDGMACTAEDCQCEEFLP